MKRSEGTKAPAMTPREKLTIAALTVLVGASTGFAIEMYNKMDEATEQTRIETYNAKAGNAWLERRAINYRSSDILGKFELFKDLPAGYRIITAKQYQDDGTTCPENIGAVHYNRRLEDSWNIFRHKHPDIAESLPQGFIAVHEDMLYEKPPLEFFPTIEETETYIELCNKFTE